LIDRGFLIDTQILVLFEAEAGKRRVAMKAERIARPWAILLALSIFVASTPASADPSDLTGQWYGNWQVEDPVSFGGNFGVDFVNSPYGILAVMYLPELGLFDEYLPVMIDEGPTGTIVTIGIAGLFELQGVLDGTRLSGGFYAFAGGDPPLIYTGSWFLDKYVPEDLVLGEAPGPLCDDLPPLYCVGDVFHCTELVLFEPAIGDGWADYPGNYPETEENQVYSYIRRDLMQLVQYATAKVACKTAGWEYGNFDPLALGDMSEADGSTPALLTLGQYYHPPGTHEGGRDIDTAYYQVFTEDNRLRPICLNDGEHCVDTPYALDFWRTALYIAYLAEHPHMRVVGVDGQAGLILEAALDELVASGWIEADLRSSIPLAYEVEDTGLGWYRYHHHHNHISMNTVYDAVASAEIQPDTLNRDSQGKSVTLHLELYEGLDAALVDANSLALTLDGHTMLYAQPGDVTLSDYNDNGIVDITAKFDRQLVAEAVDSGEVEIAISGLFAGQYFFQTSDTIYVLGTKPSRDRPSSARFSPQQARPGTRGIVDEAIQ
jgi:hypothetical protein